LSAAPPLLGTTAVLPIRRSRTFLVFDGFENMHITYIFWHKKRAHYAHQQTTASNKQQSGPSFDLRQDGYELSYSVF
jgi:hypothetical protein